MPYLGPPLLVLVLVRHPVHLQAVALQGATLGEGFLAKVTFIRPHSCNNGKCQEKCKCKYYSNAARTCMSSRVSLQIEGVVEPLAAEGAEVSLGVAVALHVPVEQPLQREALATHAARELAGVRLAPQRRQLLHLLLLGHVSNHRVLDPVPAVDQLQRRVRGDPEL